MRGYYAAWQVGRRPSSAGGNQRLKKLEMVGLLPDTFGMPLQGEQKTPARLPERKGLNHAVAAVRNGLEGHR